nr:hypothetical protein Itr_chr12CG12450 [Ipomoea trifida]
MGGSTGGGTGVKSGARGWVGNMDVLQLCLSLELGQDCNTAATRLCQLSLWCLVQRHALVGAMWQSCHTLECRHARDTGVSNIWLPGSLCTCTKTHDFTS